VRVLELWEGNGRRRLCLPDKVRILEEASPGREREFAAKCARKTPWATLGLGTDIAPRLAKPA